MNREGQFTAHELPVRGVDVVFEAHLHDGLEVVEMEEDRASVLGKIGAGDRHRVAALAFWVGERPVLGSVVFRPAVVPAFDRVGRRAAGLAPDEESDRDGEKPGGGEDDGPGGNVPVEASEQGRSPDTTE